MTAVQLMLSDYGFLLINLFIGLATTLAGSTRGQVDGMGTNAQFDGPRGVAMDTVGNIVVVESNNPAASIRIVTPAGQDYALILLFVYNIDECIIHTDIVLSLQV